MNPLLLPEYLMDKIKKWSEKTSGFYGGQLLNMAIVVGLTVALGVFLSGAPYVSTYFEAVPSMIDLSSYGYGIFFYLPRVLGDPLSQTRLEMVYVLISYLFAGAGMILMIRASRSVSQRSMTILAGSILIALSLLMIVVLDYLKTTALR
ncbi:MAG: hypothetical protein QW304_02050 [Thermoproteota archaeon]